MKVRKDHNCHANYDANGFVSIDIAAEILGVSQDKARDALKKAGVKTMTGRVKKEGRPLTVYSKDGVGKLYYERQKLYPRPKTPAKAAEAETYEQTYEDFFKWCSHDRSYPKLFFTEFVKLANLHDSCDSEIVKVALGDAMHDCWVAWFEKIKHYLLDVAGTKLPERPDGDGYKDMVLRFHRAMKGGAK